MSLGITKKITDVYCLWRYRRWLSPYIDGELDATTRAQLENHLAKCEGCSREFENLSFASKIISNLDIPDDVPDTTPKWISEPVPIEQTRRSLWPVLVPVTTVLLILVAASFWFYTRPRSEPMTVMRLIGKPRIGAEQIDSRGQLKTGETLETDDESRAIIEVGQIGQVEIDPNTKIRLIRSGQNEQRFALDRGRMHASILARPRVFFVETPSALAIDLGCSYSLDVDEDGESQLYVTSGWVALTLNGRESMVPAGAICITKPGIGPGAPYLQSASLRFKQALWTLDFDGGGPEELKTLLTEARREDALTLWNLLPRVEGSEREQVYARLLELVPAPSGISREQVLSLDRTALDGWRDSVEFAAAGIDPQKAMAKGSLHPVGPMQYPRYAHTATLLNDGKVLIVGGMEEQERSSGTAEVYDPATGTFTETGNLKHKRVGQTATLLKDGRVLIAGGSNEIFFLGALRTAEIYDPATGEFTETGDMNIPRLGHRATLLPDGKVLLTGGQLGDESKTASAELYDPATGLFTRAPDMNFPRSDHTMTLLTNGKVLIVGGAINFIRSKGEVVTPTSELYDPATNSFVRAGNLSIERYKHSAVLLPDGRVLIVGGSNSMMYRGRYASAEIYDPATGAFALTGNMRSSRYKIRDAAVLLKDGKVMVAGGGPRVEVYDTATGIFSAVPGDIGSDRYYSTATLLQNGEVLIAGGYSNSQGMFPNASAWIYRPW
jgi:WD40 repeat protein